MPEVPDPSTEPLRRWQHDGDPEALNQLLRNEVGVLKQMIRGRGMAGLAGSASVSDIAQEAVLGLLKTQSAPVAPVFDNPRALRGYLWRSAWHLLVKRLERRERMPPRLDLDDLSGLDRFMRAAGSLDDLDRHERAMAIGVAMNLLSREDRELLRLVYFEGEDIPTAGARLGLKREAANSRLVRARRMLASRLAEWTEIVQ